MTRITTVYILTAAQPRRLSSGAAPLAVDPWRKPQHRIKQTTGLVRSTLYTACKCSRIGGSNVSSDSTVSWSRTGPQRLVSCHWTSPPKQRHSNHGSANRSWCGCQLRIKTMGYATLPGSSHHGRRKVKVVTRLWRRSKRKGLEWPYVCIGSRQRVGSNASVRHIGRGAETERALRYLVLCYPFNASRGFIGR
jgi:hypothetical protein